MLRHRFRKLPWPSTKRGRPDAKLCFEIGCGRVRKPVWSYKSVHAGFFHCGLFSNVYLQTIYHSATSVPSHPLSIMLKKGLPTGLPALSCDPKIFLTHTVGMTPIRHLPERIISLPTPQQWLSFILRLKVSLPVGETEPPELFQHLPLPPPRHSSSPGSRHSCTPLHWQEFPGRQRSWFHASLLCRCSPFFLKVFPCFC